MCYKKQLIEKGRTIQRQKGEETQRWSQN